MKYLWSRRDFLFQSGGGISGLALAYLLNKDGLNMAGATIPVSAGTIPPGDPAPLYPGNAGSATTPISPAATYMLSWLTGEGNLNVATNMAISLRLTSHHPSVATTNTVWSGFNVGPCPLRPR